GVGRGVAVVLEGIACVCGVWGSGRAAHPGRRRPRTLIDLSVRWSGSGPAQSTRSPRSSPRCTVPPLLHPSIPVILYLWSFSGAEHDHRYKITGGGGNPSGDLGDRPGPVGDLRSRPTAGRGPLFSRWIPRGPGIGRLYLWLLHVQNLATPATARESSARKMKTCANHCAHLRATVKSRQREGTVLPTHEAAPHTYGHTRPTVCLTKRPP